MLRSDDIEAAVAEAIITREQADAMLALAKRRHGSHRLRSGEDERFRFLKGFNDVFLTTGVLFVIAALIGATHVLGVPVDTSPPSMPLMIAAPLVMWGIAEILVGRMRAVLPGIVLATAFCYFTASAFDAIAPVRVLPYADRYEHTAGFGFGKAMVLCAIASAFLAATAFFTRFRFPFALLLMAATAAIGLLTAIVQLAPGTPDWVYRCAALGLGLATFAAAMRFDMSDPDRLTRRSDYAFWLHLAAAPLIVHPLIYSAQGLGPGRSLSIIATVLVLALIALAIDRRAILVASLTYLLTAIVYILRTAAGPSDASMELSLAIVGGIVLALGLGWRRLRTLVLAPFAGTALLKRLPPLHT